MKSLIYIILKSTKNNLKELRKKPGKLVMYLLVIGLIAGVAVMSAFSKPSTEQQAPMFIFTWVVFALITLFTGIAVAKGLSGGDQIFEMNDVNLLFVSPVSPRKILLYGILRLTKMAFWAGFFILFQSNTVASFGIDFKGLLLVWLCFIIDIVVLSVVSLILYNVSNSRPRRKLTVKIIAVLVFVPLVIYISLNVIAARDIFSVFELAAASPFMTLIPVAGWTAMGVTLLLTGNLLSGLLYIGANLLLGVCLVIYILLSKADYYEDTLVATETMFEKKRAAAEGKINEMQNAGKNIKVAKTGISGIGASALFGKHARESFRQNRFGFLTFTSVMIVAAAILMTFFVKSIPIVLQILMWMQIFMIGMGRGLRETYSHYIYLIPEPSFQKILWSNMETVTVTLIESILIFGVGGLLIKSNIIVILGAIAAYTLFSVMLLGINYLSMRFTGADISAGLLITIYFFVVIILAAPGIAAAVVAAVVIGGNMGMALGLVILSAWELLVGLVCFALSKGVLDNCDMPSGKPGK